MLFIETRSLHLHGSGGQGDRQRRDREVSGERDQVDRSVEKRGVRGDDLEGLVIQSGLARPDEFHDVAVEDAGSDQVADVGDAQGVAGRRGGDRARGEDGSGQSAPLAAKQRLVEVGVRSGADFRRDVSAGPADAVAAVRDHAVVSDLGAGVAVFGQRERGARRDGRR